jgi:hypothetical protein
LNIIEDAMTISMAITIAPYIEASPLILTSNTKHQTIDNRQKNCNTKPRSTGIIEMIIILGFFV